MAIKQSSETCLGCKNQLQSPGVEHFRSGGWAALMGNWAEIGRA
jgi:hypothetical protein